MIRKTWNVDKWLLTSQPEHARLAAIIASAWNFNGNKPHEEVIKAIISHDDGWKDAEQRPSIKDNGDPCSFHEMRPGDAIPIFERSIALRREAGHKYGAALIAGHFLHLMESADLTRASIRDSIAAGQFIARNRKVQATLMAELAQDEAGKTTLENYKTDLRFLQICDYLSLLLCTDFTGQEVIRDVPYLPEGDQITVTRKNSNLALTLDPLPFKKNLRDHLTSWIIPYIPYESSEELLAAMDETRPVTNEVHLGA